MGLKIEGPYSITTNDTPGKPGVTTYHQGAIAPPVAAGSVDSPAFRNMLATWSGHNEAWRIRHASESMDGIVAHLNAWGAQQRADIKHEAKVAWDLANEYQQAAEKAEARLAELEAAYQDVLRRCL